MTDRACWAIDQAPGPVPSGETHPMQCLRVQLGERLTETSSIPQRGRSSIARWIRLIDTG